MKLIGILSVMFLMAACTASGGTDTCIKASSSKGLFIHPHVPGLALVDAELSLATSVKDWKGRKICAEGLDISWRGINEAARATPITLNASNHKIVRPPIAGTYVYELVVENKQTHEKESDRISILVSSNEEYALMLLDNSIRRTETYKSLSEPERQWIDSPLYNAASSLANADSNAAAKQLVILEKTMDSLAHSDPSWAKVRSNLEWVVEGLQGNDGRFISVRPPDGLYPKSY